MASIAKLVTVLGATVASIAATPAVEGTFELVVLNPELEAVGLLVFLTSVTALTFIAVLLACGLREPALPR